jgi:diadenosine tetraphosphate (Ap4A) HIT family hydrolase
MSTFLNKPKSEWLYEGNYFFLIYDSFPVSPGHILIITKRLVNDYFGLYLTELNEFNYMVNKAKEIIEKNNKPDGYNIGMNCGADAGQTIMHFHYHVIPRYKGDVKNPRGGVRGVIPNKMKY